MEKTFMLEIITPEKQFFTGEVESPVSYTHLKPF